MEGCQNLLKMLIKLNSDQPSDRCLNYTAAARALHECSGCLKLMEICGFKKKVEEHNSQEFAGSSTDTLKEGKKCTLNWSVEPIPYSQFLLDEKENENSDHDISHNNHFDKEKIMPLDMKLAILCLQNYIEEDISQNMSVADVFQFVREDRDLPGIKT